MADHTKGQLAYSFEGDGSARVFGPIRDDATSVCTVAVLTITHRSMEEVRANARRLVACWNACQKMTTEMVEEIDGALPVVHSYHVMRRDRDALLVALKELVLRSRADGVPNDSEPAVDAAEEVLMRIAGRSL
jgi:hypothetical protein